MWCSRRSVLVVLTVAGLVSVLALPSLARADGGPILSNPEVWALIDEGQQIAVVRLQQDGTARVHLFISLADRSGQSHEVTFFLPLGVGASDLSVVEETSLAFDQALTAEIDKQLQAESRREPDYRARVQFSLLVGTLATHGAWSLLPAALSSWSGIGMAGGAPAATFETPNSQVAVYDIDSETDLQALIETTGLDPKVKETLAALQGQQIAVVKLQTQPVEADERPTGAWQPASQAGLHLGWLSTLVPHPSGASYSYPLGTGRAWASPIELTRVYVISPPELDFRVEYPRLGEDLSGMQETRRGSPAWRIDGAESPAYAVDEAYGDFGHIWRATYVKSNSEQDLVVTGLPGVSREVSRAVSRARFQGVVGSLTWPIGLLVGLAAWLASWWVVMSRRLGVPYRWREARLYRDALLWLGLYLVTNLVVLPAVASSGPYWRIRCAWLVVLPGIVAMLVPLGVANAYIYASREAQALQVTRGRAFGAYLLAVLMANASYAAFAAGYGALVGAI